MGMIAEDKDTKRHYLKEILPQLWCGQLSKVISYLQPSAGKESRLFAGVTHLPENMTRRSSIIAVASKQVRR
jgi:hypothetical protein